VTTRVLVARLDSMGDVLLAGPAVRAVASRAHVLFLAGPAGAAAARLLPGVDDVLVWDSPWISDPAPQVQAPAIRSLVRSIRRARPDAAVILTSFHQSPLPLALVLRLAGVPHIAGASVDHAGSLLDVRLRPGEDLPEDIPEAERAVGIVGAAGYPLPAGDDGLLAVTGIRRVELGTEPYVVVHPGASVPARTWPADRFAAATRIIAEAGMRVIVTGGADERELTATVAGISGVDLGGRLSLPELAGVLAGARAVLVGNTGPAHLAAAVRTPVVSLFSPVVPAVRWAPYGIPVVLLGDQSAACRDSRARVCPVPGHPCLNRVGPETAARACLRLASEPAGRSRGAAADRPRTERQGVTS
jgi:ADP-heptose:LPS heptosyltransferase